MAEFDRSKLLKIGFFFKPFYIHADGTSLATVNLRLDEELIVFDRHGETCALLAREMAYHHMAQGELAGGPYLVTF